MTETVQPFLVSNDALDDAAELRRRLADDGYVFFKRLLDPDRVLELRREMLEVIARGGWLRDGTDPFDGIADPSMRCTEGDLGYTDVYHEVYKLESFHRAGHWPAVLDTMSKLIPDGVLPHPHKVARLWFPQFTDHTTPAHQDFVHFQGNFETLTCWSPVGECPVELGGLAVVPGSHKVDSIMDHHFSLGAGALTVDMDPFEGRWHSNDYEVGDALIFGSLLVHRALANVTEDRLRVSLDNRYQAASDPIAEHMLIPHLVAHSPLSWDEVYAGWETRDLQYYWKDLDLTVVPRDTAFFDHGFDEALQRARDGDDHARLHLERIVKRDPSTDYAKAAAEVVGVPD